MIKKMFDWRGYTLDCLFELTCEVANDKSVSDHIFKCSPKGTWLNKFRENKYTIVYLRHHVRISNVQILYKDCETSSTLKMVQKC